MNRLCSVAQVATPCQTAFLPRSGDLAAQRNGRAPTIAPGLRSPHDRSSPHQRCRSLNYVETPGDVTSYVSTPRFKVAREGFDSHPGAAEPVPRCFAASPKFQPRTD